MVIYVTPILSFTRDFELASEPDTCINKNYYVSSRRVFTVLRTIRKNDVHVTNIFGGRLFSFMVSQPTNFLRTIRAMARPDFGDEISNG